MPPPGIAGAAPFSSGLSEMRASVVRIMPAMLAAGIPDPTKVVRAALQNAASIAALFLTTEAVIADKPEKEKAPAGAGGDMGGMDF